MVSSFMPSKISEAKTILTVSFLTELDPCAFLAADAALQLELLMRQC